MTKTTKRRPLSKEQLTETKRLKAAWDRRKKERGRKLTQESAAAQMEMTAGAVWQYLQGKIPLNTDAIFLFSKVLEIETHEIRRSLKPYKLEDEAIGKPTAADLLHGVRELDPEGLDEFFRGLRDLVAGARPRG